MSERERERERGRGRGRGGRETDRQTDRQTDGQTGNCHCTPPYFALVWMPKIWNIGERKGHNSVDRSAIAYTLVFCTQK